MDVVGVIVLASIMFFVTQTSTDDTNVTKSLAQAGARVYRNGNASVCSVTLNDKRIDGETLADVSKLRRVESLSLSHSVLGSGQAKHLPEMKSLRTLSLYETNISSFELNYVGECKMLEVLSLDGTPIGDSGLKSLVDLKNLRYLSLARTAIGDGSVEFLSRLTGLAELDLRRTELTARAIRRLRGKLPNCQITTEPIQEKTRLARRGGRRHRMRQFSFRG